MFQRFRDLIKHVSGSRWFHGLRLAFLWLAAVYSAHSVIMFLIALKHSGISFREAMNLFFAHPWNESLLPVSVVLGFVAGLVWYLRRKKRSGETEEEPEQESAGSPAPEREEGFPEKPRTMSR